MFKRPMRLAGAGLFVAVLALASPGSAQDLDGTRISLDKARALALQLTNQGQADAAKAIAVKLIEGNPNDVLALIALSRSERLLGQHRAAERAGKRAWRSSTSDTEKFASAIATAQSISAGGAKLRAQLWLRRAAQVAPNEQMRASAIRDFRHLRGNTPASVSLRFSIQPSSNINGGSSSQTTDIGGLPFQLTGAALALSGLEYRVGGTFSYRHRISPRQLLTYGVNFDARAFSLSSDAQELAPDTSASEFAFEQLDVSIGSTLRDKEGTGVTFVGLGFGQNWFGGSTLSRFARVSAGRGFQLRERTNGTVNLSAERQARQDNNLFSANIVTLSAGVVQRYDSGRLSLTGYVRDTSSESATIASQAVGATLSYAFAQPIFAGVGLELSLGAERRDFDRPQPLFGLREDRTVRARATMIFTDVDYYGFSPTAELSVSRTDSTVAANERENIGVRLGLRSSF